MKILIIAPGIVPPWTEGRKNFVRDLLAELDVFASPYLLTTQITSDRVSQPQFSVPAYVLPIRHKLPQLALLKKETSKIILKLNPDVVLHFPYGTFHGVRGWFNRQNLTRIYEICQYHHLPCFTILYSMTQGNLCKMEKKFPVLITAPTFDWSGRTIYPGIDLNRFPSTTYPSNDRSLLFMAGYQENSSRLLRNILYERGLIEIIKAGSYLGHRRFHLSIAIPLLRYPERRAELQAYLTKLAPDLPVRILTDVSPSQLLTCHSIYLFPYQKNLRVFIPTSVIEAMAIGIPVLLSRLPMFSPLDRHPTLCSFYEPSNPMSLAETLIKMTHDWRNTLEQAKRGVEYVRRYWNIHYAAKQILHAITTFHAQSGIKSS